MAMTRHAVMTVTSLRISPVIHIHQDVMLKVFHTTQILEKEKII